ncbi:helix-turn-helix domain-containing protein [Pseudomonas quasicaspiana]|uniref:helix-turn-helix domain-containing protein n=1 Tax=Pseudomonas quasicaspiana TaxID=2829821 RepID=UPI001E4C9A6C|nr:helix-turn-helix transcriptional regulator [Pseudomonas quasicaspiana]MCD5978797.1 helix-turn-helix transcriptional regulator [Pseudomonas quasicaspiana]
MQRIQELRTTLGVPMADFAKALGVSEQVVGQWESGEAEPGVPALRDIATLLGTNVDDLMDFATSGRRITSQHWVPGDDAIFDGFWGRIGLLLPGETNCTWYPVTFAEYSQITDSLSIEHAEPQWLVVSTLNNRKLLINPALIRRIRLLDDAADRPEDDAWQLGWDSEEGLTPELYRALGEYFTDELAFDTNNSPVAQQVIHTLIAQHDLTSAKVMNLISDTHVHLASGSTANVRAANADIYNLVLDAYAGMPLGISLSTRDSEEENHFSPSQVALVDIPLLQYQTAEIEASAEMEGV